MVDESPDPYRPRRALPADDAEPVDHSVGRPGPLEEDAPKPLYRDEVYGPDEPTVAITGRPGSGTGSRSSTESAAEQTSEQTQILARARARSSGSRAAGGPRPDRRRAHDSTREDVQTTILPRTAAGARVRRETEDDLLDDQPPRRSRTGLLIGAVAAVVVLGLALGYTVLSLTRQSAAPGVAPSVPAGSVPPGPSGSPSGGDPTTLLTDAMLITPQIATKVAGDRTWKVQLTQKGKSADSPQPACFGGEAVEGQPIPQQSLLRVLNSTGTAPPALLQQADAYATPEEAAQAYAVAAKTLGGCSLPGSYIDSGAVVTGLGDQSTGLTLRVVDGATPQFRTVVLARTGRVVDIVDAAQSETAIDVDKVAAAAADALNTQCRPAGGRCASGVRVAAAPPPLGGDVLGLLATSDLPPVGSSAISWVGTKAATPKSGAVQGSGCERVDWGKEPATARIARTYLLQDSTSQFGLDEVVLTLKTADDATKLAEEIRDNWADCEKRLLTSKVDEPKKFETTGARGTPVAGWTTVVKQSSAGNPTFRVGIAAAGAKVVFTFLNPQDDLDLSADQFEQVTARAGQRATQVK